MLLQQFKLRSAASTLCSESSYGFKVRKSRSLGRPESLQVRASTSGESTGWLDSASMAFGEVATYVEKKIGKVKDEFSHDVVDYFGTAVIMKKLQMLDLIDRVADIQDDTSELVAGKHVTVQLVSTDIDPHTGKPLMSDEEIFSGWPAFEGAAVQNVVFQLRFTVPRKFGVPGAIIVHNQHPNEFLLISFDLELPDRSTAHYVTDSWVYNTENTDGRIFFRNKAYLPADTPEALKELREKELQALRGDGTGERKPSDRIYDYAVYNDLGSPDEDPKLERPNLGGNEEYPFPRRIRTGRPPAKCNPKYETRKTKKPFYIPRDECFERKKMDDFMADGLRSIVHSASSKISVQVTRKSEFNTVEEIKKLFAAKGKKVGGINNVLPHKTNVPTGNQHPLVFLHEVLTGDFQSADPLLYPLPQILHADDKAWQNNDEFARQFLAGLNPVVIELVTEFPLKSSLDPAEFGDPTSAISEDHVIGELEGLSVQQAVSEKKLFVADYHDAFLPFIARINSQKNRAQYATRALFFLRNDNTLKVLALELVLPRETPDGEKMSRVLTPPTDNSKTDYMWEIAKAHVANNDLIAHQVFSHFTRCHAVTEPVIIAANRQLSKLHPIYQLMVPHFRHTIEVNSTARLNLLPARGTIEEIYTPREYVVQMASAYYRDHWTFDSNALPNDLIKRGMAERESSAKHGVKLAVEDYPYAADGLEIWDAMKKWNTDYIDIFYEDDNDIQKDIELQKWYTEYRTVGHGDKKDTPGWPELKSKKDLAFIVTTMQWIATAMHAPINFGQYDYAGFMPHHPAITRRLIPDEGTKEWDEFQANPEKFFLSMVSDTDTTTTAMAVFEVVAAHAPNEEYINERSPIWTENKKVQAAFKRYCDKLKDIDQLIQERNADKNLKNRCGVAQLPFQLLRPHSAPGVTAMGIPNSITV
ncbi:unnamed protein product [Sphagnum troendelagicum]|uniref:Lipoxygenase n=1 Tax=Sphagnum troendelagicum TaxID=128251 RepID=A0ABP0TUE4_9BRYO